MSALSKLLEMAKFTASEVVVAYLVGFVATGGDAMALAKIILAIKLNIFALPLSYTPALALPLWTWYIISVLWIRQWLYYSEYGAEDVIAQLESLVDSTPTTTKQPVATDGGEEDC